MPLARKLRPFRDRDTVRVWWRLPVRKLGLEVLRSALRKVLPLDAAETLQDLQVPLGNQLEKLKGSGAA